MPVPVPVPVPVPRRGQHRSAAAAIVVGPAATELQQAITVRRLVFSSSKYPSIRAQTLAAIANG